MNNYTSDISNGTNISMHHPHVISPVKHKHQFHTEFQNKREGEGEQVADLKHLEGCSERGVDLIVAFVKVGAGTGNVGR